MSLLCVISLALYSSSFIMFKSSIYIVTFKTVRVRGMMRAM